jgi:hypothetical protein
MRRTTEIQLTLKIATILNLLTPASPTTLLVAVFLLLQIP